MTPLTSRVLIVSPRRSRSISRRTAFVTCVCRSRNRLSRHITSASYHTQSRRKKVKQYGSVSQGCRVVIVCETVTSLHSGQAPTHSADNMNLVADSVAFSDQHSTGLVSFHTPTTRTKTQVSLLLYLQQDIS